MTIGAELLRVEGMIRLVWHGRKGTLAIEVTRCPLPDTCERVHPQMLSASCEHWHAVVSTAMPDGTPHVSGLQVLYVLYTESETPDSRRLDVENQVHDWATNLWEWM